MLSGCIQLQVVTKRNKLLAVNNSILTEPPAATITADTKS